MCLLAELTLKLPSRRSLVTRDVLPFFRQAIAGVAFLLLGYRIAQCRSFVDSSRVPRARCNPATGSTAPPCAYRCPTSSVRLASRPPARSSVPCARAHHRALRTGSLTEVPHPHRADGSRGNLGTGTSAAWMWSASIRENWSRAKLPLGLWGRFSDLASVYSKDSRKSVTTRA